MPPLAESVDIRQPRRDRDADLSARRVHIGFRRPDVRPLVDQLARQADRQVCRQLEMARDRISATISSAENCPASAVSRSRCWASCFSSGGKQSARPGQAPRPAPAHRLGPPGPKLNWRLEDVEKVALDLDDALGRRDLAAQRGFLDRGGDDIAGQREIGGFELEQLLLGHARRGSRRRGCSRPRYPARSSPSAGCVAASTGSAVTRAGIGGTDLRWKTCCSDGV